MEKLSNERIEELKAIAEDYLEDQDWFDYHDWDGLIECEEELTDDELTWMRENFEVTLTITRKQP